ncbi:SPFH domain-containing protein [Pseudomonas neustonica]|jgi:regulator of protease activity HflC (stomatin/prohibitin superfamily)|uniref:Paraslipin n=1 Tax=Pseudomonas neustonica TaxID=2487346 RepID=A0ABX9XIA7_9PSED|nr:MULTISPECIES: stomatin-like protein [Pseudomonas]MAB25792.1 paraslipin [Pseudomonadales bacterium]MBA6419811.1 paraslipin [Pseudomonas sp. 5Ae-yellow]ROZ83016.1 paraslipin [Pseudomonas sp. SSM44]ROZ84886.1 paraslipin [Pseudomonas neustonica]|tara:strand:- start:3757 stop:4677 length:921 start_codon:yes stop_codon:yes gene_type:complete
MEMATILSLAFLVLVIVTLAKTARIVPQRSAFIVERLGKYAKTLEAGFHLLIPFVDRVSYKHTLKEEAIDVPSQACVTRDNIQVVVDGVLYLQVVDPKLASYGINDYRYASMQLAQTTLRSVVGKIDLDKTFEERETINVQVVQALDEAAKPWGVKVLRYEIADIELPATILDALEKQMRAERERRAVVAQSEGEREAKINVSEGQKQETINLSEADKQRQINEAEGKAREIELIATATAEGLRRVAEAINTEGGQEAVSLRVAEQYVKEFGKLAQTNNTMILPAELSNIGSAVAAITKTLEVAKK